MQHSDNLTLLPKNFLDFVYYTGDNLGQVEVCGLCKNFSTMDHSCRKCLCDRSTLYNADVYSEMHADSHLDRNDQEMQANFLEAKACLLVYFRMVKMYHGLMVKK